MHILTKFPSIRIYYSSIINNISFGDLALTCFFETFLGGGGVAGWLEIMILLEPSRPLGLELRLRVCQKQKITNNIKQNKIDMRRIISDGIMVYISPDEI